MKKLTNFSRLVRMSAAGGIISIIAWTASAQTVAPHAAGGPPPATAAVDGRFADAAALLDTLETADRDLVTFSADIQLVVYQPQIEGGGQQVRRGRLFYSTEGKKRRFQVDFLTLIVDSAKRDDPQTFIFDGEYLIERQIDQKLQIKRRIVAPGENADPLRLGEGPFPIPVGQKRADILKRFDVTLVPAHEGWAADAMPAILKCTWQLRLKPRAGTDEARDFKDVRIWYYDEKTPKGQAASRILPRFSRTENTDGTRHEVVLAGIKINQALPEGTFDTTLPKGWREQEEEFRRPADQKGAEQAPPTPAGPVEKAG